MEMTAEGDESLRAMLPVAGRRIARHQLDCALALGCETIALYRDRGEGAYVSIEAAAQRAGA